MPEREAGFLGGFSKALALGFVARRLTKRRAPPAEEDAAPRPRPETREPEPQQPTPNQPRKHLGIFGIVKKTISQFMDDDCTTMGAAIAYYTTFSIAPLLLIIISIAGLIFSRQAVQHQIQSQIQGLIGSGPASEIGVMVENAGQHSSTGVLGAALGLIALVFGATGAFTQLQSSLDRVWRVKPDPRGGGVRAFVGQRILSLGMILGIAFLLVVSLAVSAALSAFGNWLAAFLPKGFSGGLLHGIEIVVSFVIIAALFGLIFKFLPDARIPWEEVWIGAGLTSILFTIGKSLIGIYLGHSGAASAYGAAGSFVLIVLWVYYSSLIFLLGAEFTQIWLEAHAGSAPPKPGAVRVSVEEKIQPKRAA